MSDRRKDGGQAFPMPAHTSNFVGFDHEKQDGMSLRDWLAGQAMQGLLASGRYDSWDYLAEDSWNIADEMIAQREANNGEAK